MPLFVLKCGACEHEAEKLCSHATAIEVKCEKCGGDMTIVPSRSAFKVNGYSFENGYHRETINYDGSPG